MKTSTCPNCKGTGKVLRVFTVGMWGWSWRTEQRLVECPTCRGSGAIATFELFPVKERQ